MIFDYLTARSNYKNLNTSTTLMQTDIESRSLFAAGKKTAFLLLCVASFLLLYIKKEFIENETAAFEFLQDRPEGGILQLISAIQLFSIPLIYLWKFT